MHTAEATAANIHDITMAAKLLREDDKVVWLNVFVEALINHVIMAAE